MSTRKLYYEDCHLATFSARVVSCERAERGYQVILDQTAFYPEGGGQPWDLGVLGDAQVLEVREQGEDVVHLCDKALEVGAEVTGSIDYARRFDFMQQHSGEHMVSGVVHRRFGYQNSGFHMGADVLTVDFDGPIPPEALPEIEQEVNAAIWQNIPLKTWVPSPEELPGVFYRTKRALPGPVRIVEIPGVDSCACCGIHVGFTGEIGLVKIFSCVKFHQGVRLEMACGKRAMDYLTAVFEENRQVSQAFSAKILETGAAARRMNEVLAADKFRITGLERRLFDSIAQGYVNQGNVLHFEQDLEPVSVRELADRIAARCGGRAAVFSGSDEAGYSFCLAAREGDLRPFAKEMTGSLNGRGGGKPGFVQGSVKATQAEIEAFFRK